MKTAAYAAQSNTSPMTPFEIERREPGPHDVQIDILYCGICHSDIHMAHNDWNMTVYPVVPGHEIVGRVVKAGAQVKKFKPGDLVGVGCMVESCRTCPSCKEGLEHMRDRLYPDVRLPRPGFGGYDAWRLFGGCDGE